MASQFLGLPIEAPQFVLVLAQPSSVRWLKAELAREHPELSNSYSRPGVYTFKASHPLDEGFALRSVFARHWAFSLGTFANPEALVERIGSWDAPLCLFVSARQPGEPGAQAQATELRSALRSRRPTLFSDDLVPALGQTVVDVVVGGADEPCVVGWHRHSAGRGTVPGGVVPAVIPGDAPSRAYAKLAEALAWSALELLPGDHAVEVGSAPGGSVALLLSLGVHVTGIDPGDMAVDITRWARNASFTHLKRPVGSVKRSELPGRVRWLICDANLAPRVALHYLEQLAAQLRPHLEALIFTVKLNDERVAADLPALLSKLEALGPTRAVQLPSHRSEVVAVVRLRA